MERKRLTATGTTKWTCHNVGRILQNATYRGYIGYNKSYSNNYLEQKRIHNLNKDSYEYVKDDLLLKNSGTDVRLSLKKSVKLPLL